MNEIYRTEGIVLEKKDLGEADQVLTVFSKEFGKIALMAKAVRKITSKLRPGADFFRISEFEFVQGKRLKTLTDASIISRFSNIKENPEKAMVCLDVFSRAEKIIHGQEKEIRIWDFFLRSLNVLEKEKNGNFSLFPNFFCWNLLDVLGYRVSLEKCPVCRKKLEAGMLAFDSKGFGHNSCIGPEFGISDDSLKIIRIFFHNKWTRIFRLKKDSFDLEEMKKLTALYIQNVE